MDRGYARQYADYAQWHWWFRGRERIIGDVLHRTLATRPAPALAVLGSGPAEGLGWLERVVGPAGRVVAVDLEPLHARPPTRHLAYVIGAIEALPLAARAFDAVLALDVLEHLADDAAALREAARLLVPDGLLLVTVPAAPSLWGAQDVVSHHKRRYTRAALLDTFVRAGVPRPAVTHFNTLLWPPVAAVRWVRRALGRVETARSDFEDSRPGLANDLLAAVFSFERHLVGRVPLPVGVSLLATARPGAPE